MLFLPGHQSRRGDHHQRQKAQPGTKDSTVHHSADHQRCRPSDSKGPQSDTCERTLTKASDMPGVKQYKSSSQCRDTQCGAKPFKALTSRDKLESAIRHYKVTDSRAHRSKASATQSSSRSSSCSSRSQHVNIDKKLNDRSDKSEHPSTSTQNTFVKADRQTTDIDTSQFQKGTTDRKYSQHKHPSKTINKKEQSNSSLKEKQSNSQSFTKPQHTKSKVGVSKSSATKNKESSESKNPQASSSANLAEETMSLSDASNRNKESKRSTRYPPGIEKTLQTIADKLTMKEGKDASSSKEKQPKSKMKETTRTNVSLTKLISESKLDSVSKTPQKEKKSSKSHTLQKQSQKKDMQNVPREAKISKDKRKGTADDKKLKRVQKTGSNSKDVLSEPLKPFTFGNSSVSERRFSLEDIVSPNEQQEKMDDKMNDNQSCNQSNDQVQTSPVMKPGLDEDLPILVRSRRRSEKQQHPSLTQGNIQISPQEKSPKKRHANNDLTATENSNQDCCADLISIENNSADKLVFENTCNTNRTMEDETFVDRVHDAKDTDIREKNEGPLKKENSTDGSPKTVKCKFLNFLPLPQNVKEHNTSEPAPTCSNVLETVESRDTLSCDKDSEMKSMDSIKLASRQSDNPRKDVEKHESANKTGEISAKDSNEIITETLRNLKSEPEWELNDIEPWGSTTKISNNYGSDKVNNTEDSSRNLWDDLQLGEKAVSSAKEQVKNPVTEAPQTKKKSSEASAQKMDKGHVNSTGARKTWQELLKPTQEPLHLEIPLILTTIKTEPVSLPNSSTDLNQCPQDVKEPNPQQSELATQGVLQTQIKQEQIDDKINDVPVEKSVASPFQQKQLDITPYIKQEPMNDQVMRNDSKNTDAIKSSTLEKQLTNKDSVDTVEVSNQYSTIETGNDTHATEVEKSKTVGNISKLPEIHKNVYQQAGAELTCDKAMNKETTRSKPAISPIRYISKTQEHESTVLQTTVESNTSANSTSNAGAEGIPVDNRAQKKNNTDQQMESNSSMDSQCEKVKPMIKKPASNKRTVILTDSFLPKFPQKPSGPQPLKKVQIDSAKKPMNNNGTREKVPTHIDSNEKSENDKKFPEVKSDVRKLTPKSSIKPIRRESKEVSSVVNIVKEKTRTNFRQTREQSVARQIVKKSIGVRATPARSIKSTSKLTVSRKSNKENLADDRKNSSRKDSKQTEPYSKRRMEQDPNSRIYEPDTHVGSKYIQRGNERSTDPQYDYQREKNSMNYFNKYRESSAGYGYERNNKSYDQNRSRDSRNPSREYSFSNDFPLSPTQSSSSWDRDSWNYGHSYWIGYSYRSRSPSPTYRQRSPRNRSLTPPNRYARRSRSPLSRSRSPPFISSYQRSRSPTYRSLHQRSESPRYRSLYKRSESPCNRSWSSNTRSSPYRRRSPYRRTNSPVHKSRSPPNKSSSPYCRSRSSSQQSGSPYLRQNSPKCRSQSPKDMPDQTKPTDFTDQSAKSTWWKNYTAKTVEENFREISKSGSKKPQTLSHDMKSKGKNEQTSMKKSQETNSVKGKEKANKENTNVQTGANSPVICVSNLIQIPTTSFTENNESINTLAKPDFQVNEAMGKSRKKENKKSEEEKSTERQTVLNEENKQKGRNKDRVVNETILYTMTDAKGKKENNAKGINEKPLNTSTACVQIETSSSEPTVEKEMIVNSCLKEEKIQIMAAKETRANRSRNSPANLSQNESGKQDKINLTTSQYAEEEKAMLSSKKQAEMDGNVDINIKESGKSDKECEKTRGNRYRSSSANLSQNESGKQDKKHLTTFQCAEKEKAISSSKKQEEMDENDIKESGKSYQKCEKHQEIPLQKTEDNTTPKPLEECHHPAIISKYVDVNLKNMTHIYTSDGEQVCNSFNMSKFTNIGCPGTCGHLHLSLPLYDPLTKTNMSVPQTDKIEVLRDKKGYAFFFNLAQKMICNNFNSEDGCKNNNCMMTHTSFYDTFNSYFERKLKYKTASVKNKQHSINMDETNSSKEPKEQTDEEIKSKVTMPDNKSDKIPVDVCSNSFTNLEKGLGDTDQTKVTGTKEFPIIISPMKPETSKDENSNSGNTEEQKSSKHKTQKKDSKSEWGDSTCKPKTTLHTSVETQNDLVQVVEIKPLQRTLCRFFNTARGCRRMNCPFRHIPPLVRKRSMKSLPQGQQMTSLRTREFTMPDDKSDKEHLNVGTNSLRLKEEGSVDTGQTKETGTKEFQMKVFPLKPETSKDENSKNTGNKEDKKLSKYKTQEKDSKSEGDESTCKPKTTLPTSVETDNDLVPVVNIKPHRKPCRFFDTPRGCTRWNCPFAHIQPLDRKRSMKSFPRQLMTKASPKTLKRKLEERKKNTATAEQLAACIEENCNIKTPEKSDLGKRKKVQKFSNINISDKTSAFGSKKQSEIQKKDDKSESNSTAETKDENKSALVESNETTSKSSENIDSADRDSISEHKSINPAPVLPTSCTKDTEKSNISSSKVIENPDLPASKKRKLQSSSVYTRPKRSRGYRTPTWRNDRPTRHYDESDFYPNRYNSNRLYWRSDYTENVGLSYLYPGFDDPWDYPYPHYERHYLYDYSEDVQF